MLKNRFDEDDKKAAQAKEEQENKEAASTEGGKKVTSRPGRGICCVAYKSRHSRRSKMSAPANQSANQNLGGCSGNTRVGPRLTHHQLTAVYHSYGRPVTEA